MTTIIEKIRHAKSEADKKDGTTGKGLPLAKNPYFPHEQADGDNKRMEEMWWNDIWRKGNKKSNKVLRAKMYKKYKVVDNVKDRIENDVQFLNQGHVGGCFMTSVLNLLQLGGQKDELNAVLKNYGNMSLKKLRTASNFKNMYLNKMNLQDCGYNTYLQPLESLEQKTLLD